LDLRCEGRSKAQRGADRLGGAIVAIQPLPGIADDGAMHGSCQGVVAGPRLRRNGQTDNRRHQKQPDMTHALPLLRPPALRLRHRFSLY
jgi:hypothetical protein